MFSRWLQQEVQTNIVIGAWNVLIFISINLVYLSVVSALARLAFELSASRKIIAGGFLRIEDGGPWGFSDGTRKMKLALLMYCTLYLVSSFMLEMSFDGGNFYAFKSMRTTALERVENPARDCLFESGWHIGNTNSCIKPMRGQIKVYNAGEKGTSSFVSRMYTGSFASYFPVTLVESAEPFCSDRGVRVDGAAVMFVALKYSLSKTPISTEEVNPLFQQLADSLPSEVQAHEKNARPITDNVVSTGGTKFSITHRPGLACKVNRANHRLCLVKLSRRFQVGSNMFTHVLAQEKSSNSSSWFLHALIRSPTKVQNFVDHGWRQTVSIGSRFEVDRMQLALFLVDGPGLLFAAKERPQSFAVLHSIAHVLASGPDRQVSCRRLDADFQGVLSQVRDKEQLRTGATIRIVGFLALGLHCALLSVAGGVCIYQLLKRLQQKYSGGDEFPLFAVRVTRAFYNEVVLASVDNFREPVGEGCRLVLKLGKRQKRILLFPLEDYERHSFDEV